MRRFAFLAPAPCLALTLIAGGLTIPAHADTYHIYDLGGADANVSFGITDSGTAVVRGLCNNLTDPTQTFCYTTYTDGTKTAYSDTVPTLTFDNGVACDPHGLDIEPGSGRCNGRYNAYNTIPDPHPGELMVGLIGAETAIPSYAADNVLLNDIGDVFWVDPSREEIYEAVVTPEPSTLALLGTGCLGFAGGAFRRRFQRA